MQKILILNGPNLNMLGMREPEIYGNQTLQNIEDLCKETAQAQDQEIDFRQSNHEGEIVEWVQGAIQNFDAVIINAAAYTHTSVAIHDALKLLSCPIIEVHLSDPDTREEFRHFSYIASIATKIIKGNGAQGYVQALEFIKNDAK